MQKYILILQYCSISSPPCGQHSSMLSKPLQTRKLAHNYSTVNQTIIASHYRQLLESKLLPLRQRKPAKPDWNEIPPKQIVKPTQRNLKNASWICRFEQEMMVVYFILWWNGFLLDGAGDFYSDRPKTVWQKNIVIAGFREKGMLLAWFWTAPLEERLNGAGMAKKGKSFPTMGHQNAITIFRQWKWLWTTRMKI